MSQCWNVVLKLQNLATYKISYEPCKPVPLDTIIKHGVEYISGMLAFHYIFQGQEKKQEKYYFEKQSFIISDNTIPPQKSEVLRQV